MCWATFWAIFSQTHLVTLKWIEVEMGFTFEPQKRKPKAEYSFPEV
jgi:hypothetical protein